MLVLTLACDSVQAFFSAARLFMPSPWRLEFPLNHRGLASAVKEVAMKHLARCAVFALLAGSVFQHGLAAAPPGSSAAPDWAMNATAIEACSCPMFCQCYFNTKPAGHHDHGKAETHYCRANLAYRVNHGHYGATSLDGAKFWLVNDLGGDFSQGKMDWDVLYFDKPLSPAQRAALQEIVGHLFPVQWRSNATAEAAVDTWHYDEHGAHATMDGGKTAEIRLTHLATANGPGPVVLRNLKYWGAPRNDGFVMMPNQLEAYRVGPNAFEYKGTNGFLITVDLSSKDFPPPATKPAASGR
jgi:Protein of unknown function (DUF1326)